MILFFYTISANSSAKYKKGEFKHRGRAMSWNKQRSWRLWIHDKDRSATDALMHVSGWSAHMLSVAIAQPKTLWKEVTLQHQSRGKQVLNSFVTSGDWTNGLCAAGSTTQHLSLLRCVSMFSLRSSATQIASVCSDQGSYINWIFSILERPDAHISTITCEMMLEPELEGCWELWEDEWAAGLNSGKVGGEQLRTDRHTLGA